MPGYKFGTPSYYDLQPMIKVCSHEY